MKTLALWSLIGWLALSPEGARGALANPAGDPAGLRHSTQRTAALQLGAQEGLAAHSEKIQKTLNAHGSALHSIYNFSQLLLDGYLLPPVLSRGERLFIQDDPHSARETRRLYRIIHPARLTASPPFWQDYLLFTAPPPRQPHPALRPRNQDEQQWWDRWQQRGWQAGVEQANTIFRQNLARLHRDYRGMLLYHHLYHQGLMQAPILGKTFHTTVNRGRVLRLEDRVLRLTRQASFREPARSTPTP